ncbi:hypothetical protein MKX03_021190 [Papaver bracteatum]|nr:hypothetical protein MKX03_021190 [Papaver bracteatum]
MAKGVVLDFNFHAQILLKLEKIGSLVGTCWKTSRIKFAPNFQIDGFIGAPIHSKSGVQGNIDKVAGDRLFECTFTSNVRMGDTLFFPVMATVVLPALFKLFKLLFKPLEIVEATIAGIAAAITAVNNATVAGKPSLVTLPNPIESAYLLVPVKRRKSSVCEAREMLGGEATMINDDEQVMSKDWALDIFFPRRRGKVVPVRQ